MLTNGCSIGYKSGNCLVDRNNRQVKRIKKRIQNSATFNGRTLWQDTIGVSTRRSRNLCISQKTKCETVAIPRPLQPQIQETIPFLIKCLGRCYPKVLRVQIFIYLWSYASGEKKFTKS